MTKAIKDGTVQYTCGPFKSIANFTVSGRFLTLHSEFGDVKAVLGLQNPTMLARQMLKNVCFRAVAKTAHSTQIADE